MRGSWGWRAGSRGTGRRPQGTQAAPQLRWPAQAQVALSPTMPTQKTLLPHPLHLGVVAFQSCRVWEALSSPLPHLSPKTKVGRLGVDMGQGLWKKKGCGPGDGG